MKVVAFSDDFTEQWDKFVQGHPRSTVYHYCAWHNLLRDTFGYKQEGFILLKNGNILGGLPLFEIKGFRVRRLVSSPFRDRGGLLIEEKADPSLLFDRATRLLREKDYNYLLLKQAGSSDDEVFEKNGFQKNNSWLTTVVDLTQGKDFLWSQLKNNAQGPVKQAKKYGLIVYAGQSCEDMDGFYNMFFQTRKSLGIPSFPRSFFRRIWYTMCLTHKAKLFIVKKNSLPLAGVILLTHNNTVIDGYAASLPKYRHLRGNDLLIWESLQWAIKEGFRLFDFGADSAAQKGLLAFKRKWNGQHMPMQHYFLLNKRAKIDVMDSSVRKYYYIRRTLSKLPSPLFSWISNRIVSYFG